MRDLQRVCLSTPLSTGQHMGFGGVWHWDAAGVMYRGLFFTLLRIICPLQ